MLCWSSFFSTIAMLVIIRCIPLTTSLPVRSPMLHQRMPHSTLNQYEHPKQAVVYTSTIAAERVGRTTTAFSGMKDSPLMPSRAAPTPAIHRRQYPPEGNAAYTEPPTTQPASTVVEVIPATTTRILTPIAEEGRDNSSRDRNIGIAMVFGSVFIVASLGGGAWYYHRRSRKTPPVPPPSPTDQPSTVLEVEASVTPSFFPYSGPYPPTRKSSRSPRLAPSSTTATPMSVRRPLPTHSDSYTSYKSYNSTSTVRTNKSTQSAMTSPKIGQRRNTMPTIETPDGRVRLIVPARANRPNRNLASPKSASAPMNSPRVPPSVRTLPRSVRFAPV